MLACRKTTVLSGRIAGPQICFAVVLPRPPIGLWENCILDCGVRCIFSQIWLQIPVEVCADGALSSFTLTDCDILPMPVLLLCFTPFFRLLPSSVLRLRVCSWGLLDQLFIGNSLVFLHFVEMLPELLALRPGCVPHFHGPRGPRSHSTGLSFHSLEVQG